LKKEDMESPEETYPKNEAEGRHIVSTLSDFPFMSKTENRGSRAV
jgi:hypothetical protein